MSLPEFPTDTDIMRCKDYDLCRLSVYNTCHYADRCEMLHCLSINEKIERMIADENMSK